MTDVFEEAGEDIMAEMRDAVGTYTPPGGASVPCSLIIERGVDVGPVSIEAQTWEGVTTIEVLLSELGQEPAKGGVFFDGETSYSVVKVISNDGQFATSVVK